MDASLLITTLGTVLTAIGTFVTIYYSFVVKNYKNEILEDINKVNLIGVSESLRSAQNETRKLLYPNSPTSRGIKKDEIISNIQKSIDESLVLVNLDEKNKLLRHKIIDAQNKLRYYSKSIGESDKEEMISEFHNILQDCISIAKSNANNILRK